MIKKTIFLLLLVLLFPRLPASAQQSFSITADQLQEMEANNQTILQEAQNLQTQFTMQKELVLNLQTQLTAANNQQVELLNLYKDKEKLLIESENRNQTIKTVGIISALLALTCGVCIGVSLSK